MGPGEGGEPTDRLEARWQRLKIIGLVTGPGGLFATRLVTELGGLATNPPCDKPVEDYSTLHGGPRQGFATESLRQRLVTEEGGIATNPHFEALPGSTVDACCRRVQCVPQQGPGNNQRYCCMEPEPWIPSAGLFDNKARGWPGGRVHDGL